MNVNNIYDSIKDLLEVNAISEKYNRDVLAGTKYRVLGDIAIVYFINADNRDLGEVMKAIPVLNAISIKQIENDALLNSMTRNPAVIKSMDSEIESIIGISIPKDEATSEMYIASVPSKKFGACVLAYPGFLKQAAKTIGGSFFVLPFSVHEIILVDDKVAVSADYLSDKLQDMLLGDEALNHDDYLTNVLYHYDAKANRLETSWEYVRRVAKEKSKTSQW